MKNNIINVNLAKCVNSTSNLNNISFDYNMYKQV